MFFRFSAVARWNPYALRRRIRDRRRRISSRGARFPGASSKSCYWPNAASKPTTCTCTGPGSNSSPNGRRCDFIFNGSEQLVHIIWLSLCTRQISLQRKLAVITSVARSEVECILAYFRSRLDRNMLRCGIRLDR
jgi:hypothetical protein